MLAPTPNDALGGVSLIICATCRGPDGRTGGGAALLAELRAARQASPSISIDSAACLWSCASGTSVQLRGAGRIGYVMGGFAVTDAAAVLAFAAAYDATSDGEVPFDQWPKGVLGHFIARTPPPGMAIV